MSILRAVEVAKSYGGRRVVNRVNLDVKGGEIVGLLGPNGAGKTTTFHMMVGLKKKYEMQDAMQWMTEKYLLN
jgi:lipopolysaccharide export system ATP-binding protein